MRINVIFLFLFLVIIGNLHGQNGVDDKTVILKNGFDIYKQIYDSAYKYTDSLWGKGSLYIRFTIDDHGSAKEIITSKKEPIILINLIRRLLEKSNFLLKDASNIKTGTYFILPVMYDYSEPQNITNIINKLPKVDLDKILVEKRDDKTLDTFFNVSNSEKKDIIGINAIFLPWIELRGKIQ